MDSLCVLESQSPLPVVLDSGPLTSKGGEDLTIQQLSQKAIPQRAPATVKQQKIGTPQRLVQNLSWGEQINTHVQKHVPMILNYFDRLPEEVRADCLKHGISLSFFRTLLGNLFEIKYTPVACSTFSKKNLLAIAEVAEECNVGACLEMSAVAFKHSIQNKPGLRAELFYLEGGNHVFLVLGRNPPSDPSKYKEWGGEAVICDTWSGKVFPSSEIESKLKNFVRESETPEGNPRTILEPFNPEKHVPTLLK